MAGELWSRGGESLKARRSHRRVSFCVLLAFIDPARAPRALLENSDSLEEERSS